MIKIRYYTCEIHKYSINLFQSNQNLICLKILILLVHNLGGFHPTHKQSDAERHDTFGEPDVKMGGKNMIMMFERMLQEQSEISEIMAVAQWIVQRNEQFNGKDVSRYLRDYKAVMLRYGISERLQEISFNRVVTDELQESIHEIR